MPHVLRDNLAGASMLSCAGLGDWVADDHDEYVALAARYAGDFDSLADLRGQFRQLAATSPSFDGGNFAVGLQAALRDMWRQTCNCLPVRP